MHQSISPKLHSRSRMDVKLLRLCLLLLLTSPGLARKHACLTPAPNCNECIQSGPECVWCTAPHANIRCHTLKGLRQAGCPKTYMYNPQGGVQVVKNDSSTEPENVKAPFLQPQEFSLRLRPGVSQSFLFVVTAPSDQPITELNMDIGSMPVGVNLTFTGIESGNPRVVQVNAEAAQCPPEGVREGQNRTGPWSVHITPRGFSQGVKLDITLECQCACTRNREENSPGCGGRGALVCGQCECPEPYVGKQCQTDTESFFSPGEDACRSGPNAPVCSGRGECVEGFCECDNRADPEERYSGRFCECSNFECPYSNNRMCGGHGRCMCGTCVCDAEWTDEDCSCSMETASCMAHNQVLCNGRGTCQCGTCKCDPPYSGPTCETCPTCRGVCLEHMECVECLAFGTGANKDRCERECGYLNVMKVENIHDITGLVCKMRSRDDDCLFYYNYSRTPSGGHAIVLRNKECPRP